MRSPLRVCSFLLPAWIGVLAAQGAAAAFEVASVRRAEPGLTGGRVQFLPGQFLGENVALQFVLQRVYGVRDFQIVAGPDAKAVIADGYGKRYQFQGKAAGATPEQVREMTKALLADRLGLRLHTETRPLPAYVITEAKGGVKGASPADGPSGGIEMVAAGWMRGRRVTIPWLAEVLTREVDRPVVDQTKRDVMLEFNLTWTPTDAAQSADGAGSACPASFLAMAERMKYALPGTCPSLFTAVEEQLGLKLTPQNAPVEVLVIDAIHPPSEN